jgi:hypothetical protein
MIVSRITGGLGNQMFQYAIAKSIAKKRNDTFKLDIAFYPKQSLRKYELNQFSIEGDISLENENKELSGGEGIFFKIKRKIGFHPQRPESYFPEKETSIFDKEVFKYKDNIYLDGYWQNEAYFKDIRTELLKDFTLKNKISDKAKKYLDDIKNRQSVSIHIRRGDYITNSHTNGIHGSCDLNHYKKAVTYVRKNIKNPIFYIFSDDISWCEENFNFLDGKVFINDTKNAFEDLELMKNCKHNIIANSTFSWWGAWLNESERKIVLSPSVWWTVKSEKNLALEEWVKI